MSFVHIRTFLYIFVQIRTFSYCKKSLVQVTFGTQNCCLAHKHSTQRHTHGLVIQNCKCLRLFHGEPFHHITVTKHCHSSGPESRAHLLPILFNEPCQAEGTLHKCSSGWKPYV